MIVHQTWKNYNIPDKMKPLSKTWKRFCNIFNYRYNLYSDSDLKNIISTYFPSYLNKYNSFSVNIERVDFSRYAILYLYGGIYADLDTIPLKDLTPFINLNKIILGREPLEHSLNIYNREVVICNAFMISPPKVPFWLNLMNYIVKNYEYNSNPVYATGPMAITKMYEENKDMFKDVIITDPCVFYPLTNKYTEKVQLLTNLNIWNENINPMFKSVSKYCDMNDAFVVHMWFNSWVSSKRIMIHVIIISFIIILIMIFFQKRKIFIRYK